jgi:hypothetical protein
MKGMRFSQTFLFIGLLGIIRKMILSVTWRIEELLNEDLEEKLYSCKYH